LDRSDRLFMLVRHLISWANRKSKKSKLELVFTTVLIIPFVTQIVLAVGLSAWLTIRSGQHSVNKVSTELRDEITARIHERLKHYLEQPHKVNQLIADAARLGQIDFNNLRSLELHFWRQIQVFEDLSSIGFGSKTGYYVAGDRRGKIFRLGRKDASSVDGALHMYETDRYGLPVRLSYKSDPNYDPRLRPWYRLGKNSPQGAWTSIFKYSSQEIYVISATRAIYNKKGEFQGTVLSDLMLSEINQFLKSLKFSTSGKTFIMERSGLLVASSTSQFPFQTINGLATRIAAKDSNSKLISATAKSLQQKFNNLNFIKDTQQFDFLLEGKRQFVQVKPYIDPLGLDWVIVVVIPEADFMEEIEQSTYSTIVLCAIALIITILIGVLSARWLMKPIVRLSRAARALAEGDWDRTLPLEREDEIGVLANAFNCMVKELKGSLVALEQEKANLAEAQQIAHLGSWEWDLNNNILIWSDEMFRIFGIEPSKIAPDYAEFLRYIHSEDVEMLKKAVEEAIDEKKVFEIDYRIIRPNGQQRFASAKGQPKQDKTGKVYKLVGTVTDITERKQVEMERDKLLEREKAAREAAESANRLKDEFLAVLSHELRTPLNPILGWTQMLRTNKMDPENTAKGLATIERNAHLQIKLIDDLLDVSRILQGKLVLQEIPIQLASLINAAIETVRLSAEAKSIILETVFQPEIGLVKGDPNRLLQVVGNLLSNAVKFTPNGGKILVRLDGDNSLAKITVKDTGKGIDPDFLPHVFEHFRQENSSTTRVYGGLGLGLAIVRNLVEMHGGIVTAQSAGVGMGATFTVMLPLIEIPLCKTETNERMHNNNRLDNIKVLAVDDDPDNLEFLEFLLKMYGAIVVSVSNGQEALEAVTHFCPNILLSDIGMAQMDGYHLIAQVRQLPPEKGGTIPAIALTAYAQESDHRRILQAGFQGRVTKPIEITELLNAIAHLVKV
jgi:PAS domain S-box-containing protein